MADITQPLNVFDEGETIHRATVTLAVVVLVSAAD